MKRKEYFSTYKILQLILLVLLLSSFLLISGCTPISSLLFGPSGSIEVATYPSGAKIFLNDKDTGYVTPHTFTNLAKKAYEIKVVLDDLSCTKIAIVYANKTTNVYMELIQQLYKIVAQPSYMNLKEEESRAIDSITAIYLNYGSKDIVPSACSFSSDSNHATVSSNGVVKGISEGPATITVSYTDIEITKTTTVSVYVGVIHITPPVSNPITYRALLVGVGDYLNDDGITLKDLSAPPYSVERIMEVFNHCKFGTDEVVFLTSVPLKDLSATKEAIINGIASTFSGADDNDISYFYFNGHGYLDTGTNISYLCPTNTALVLNLSTMVSVYELESHLSNIPGTKVVILDSCHSGGFIGKSKGEIINSKEKIISFNNNIINIFSQIQSKGLLTTNQYKVLTSCHDYQSCAGSAPHWVDDDPFTYCTASLCQGCGYNYFSYPYI